MLTPGDEDQRRLVTVEQAEADYFAHLAMDLTPAALKRLRQQDPAHAGQLQQPFGYNHPAWEALKAKMRPGDALWEYCTGVASWKALRGRAGYVLKRDGKTIAAIVCRMN